MRWLSPPDSVPDARASVRYSRPTSTRKVRRSRISLRMRPAISFCFGVELLRKVAEPFMRVPHRQSRGVADIGAGDLHRQRFRLQAIAVAGLAGRLAHEAADLFARPIALGFLVAAFQIGDDALEGLAHLIGAQAVVIGHADVGRRPSRRGSPRAPCRAARPRASSSRACNAG